MKRIFIIRLCPMLNLFQPIDRFQEKYTALRTYYSPGNRGIAFLIEQVLEPNQSSKGVLCWCHPVTTPWDGQSGTGWFTHFKALYRHLLMVMLNIMRYTIICLLIIVLLFKSLTERKVIHFIGYDSICNQLSWQVVVTLKRSLIVRQPNPDLGPYLVLRY